MKKEKENLLYRITGDSYSVETVRNKSQVELLILTGKALTLQKSSEITDETQIIFNRAGSGISASFGHFIQRQWMDRYKGRI